MGAIHIQSKRVVFEYYLQDSIGNEFQLDVTATVEENVEVNDVLTKDLAFQLDVTATVEENPADENGGQYPPTVHFESASWADRTGAFERMADIKTLPAAMQLSIWAKAVEMANNA